MILSPLAKDMKFAFSFIFIKIVTVPIASQIKIFLNELQYNRRNIFQEIQALAKEIQRLRFL